MTTLKEDFETIREELLEFNNVVVKSKIPYILLVIWIFFLGLVMDHYFGDWLWFLW